MTVSYSTLNHTLRVPLAAEIHSRPFLVLEAPEAVSHLAVYRDRDHAGPPDSNSASQHALLAALCGHFGVAAPAPGASYFYHDFGRFRLKWECHTEFATYTLAQRRPAGQTLAEAFAQMPSSHLPHAWLDGLAGRVLVAAHVVLEPGEGDPAQVQQAFERDVLVGSGVMRVAQLWTDFAIQSDGFSRFVIRDVGIRAQEGGRLVQRTLEIETYRMMALLGLPLAQQVGQALNAIESELAGLTSAMVATETATGTERRLDDGGAEQRLLDQIMVLAARLEKLTLDSSYRFSASKAYFRIVNARIEELREVRIEGLQTVEEFMERRLAPAMSTCEATAARQNALALRIANTNGLLRTRVGIVQELQNRQILQSLNTRAAQQLRLQQSVEGLSVAAISYYVVGLFSYAGKAAKGVGLLSNPDVALGVLVPVVAAAVWLGLRQMHRRLHA